MTPVSPRKWKSCVALFVGALILIGGYVFIRGFSIPLPEGHGLSGVTMLEGLDLDVVLTQDAVRSLPSVPDPEFEVTPFGSLLLLSDGRVWEVEEQEEDTVTFTPIDPTWKGFRSIAVTKEGALLGVRGLYLTQFSDVTQQQNPLTKALGLDGVLMPHQEVRVTSSSLPGTVYLHGTGDGIESRRVYAFYERGEVIIVCEVPDPVRAIADGTEGLYVATDRELYRFDINGEHMSILLRLSEDRPPLRSIAITEDERTLFWSTDEDIYVLEGHVSMPILRGFGGVLRVRGDTLYAFSPKRETMIRVRLPQLN